MSWATKDRLTVNNVTVVDIIIILKLTNVVDDRHRRRNVSSSLRSILQNFSVFLFIFFFLSFSHWCIYKKIAITVVCTILTDAVSDATCKCFPTPSLDDLIKKTKHKYDVSLGVEKGHMLSHTHSVWTHEAFLCGHTCGAVDTVDIRALTQLGHNGHRRNESVREVDVLDGRGVQDGVRDIRPRHHGIVKDGIAQNRRFNGRIAENGSGQISFAQLCFEQTRRRQVGPDEIAVAEQPAGKIFA